MSQLQQSDERGKASPLGKFKGLKGIFGRKNLRWLWITLAFAGVCAISVGLGIALGGFFSDDTPPTILLFAPLDGQVCEGEIVLDFGVGDNRSKITSVVVRIDGQNYPIEQPGEGFGHFQRFNLNLDTTKLSEGFHELEIIAQNSEGEGLVSTLSINFEVDNIVIHLSLSTDKTEIKPGHTLFALLESNEPCEIIESYFDTEEVYFYPEGNNWESIMPIRAAKEPGEYQLSVKVLRVDGEEETLTRDITVVSGNFEHEYIVISAKACGEGVPQWKLDEEAQKVATTQRTRTSDQLWDGSFIIPLQGKLTSPFGTYREYSTGSLGRHLGIDIAAPEGTPILACGDGVVALAEELSLQGGCIIIDHGRGVHSEYHHLSEILVEVGQVVERGDVIGEVGATGMATGSHLHWQINIGRWVVDPFEWVEEEFIYGRGVVGE